MILNIVLVQGPNNHLASGPQAAFISVIQSKEKSSAPYQEQIDVVPSTIKITLLVTN